jgi:hypothetical protein
MADACVAAVSSTAKHNMAAAAVLLEIFIMLPARHRQALTEFCSGDLCLCH